MGDFISQEKLLSAVVVRHLIVFEYGCHADRIVKACSYLLPVCDCLKLQMPFTFHPCSRQCNMNYRLCEIMAMPQTIMTFIYTKSQTWQKWYVIWAWTVSGYWRAKGKDPSMCMSIFSGLCTYRPYNGVAIWGITSMTVEWETWWQFMPAQLAIVIDNALKLKLKEPMDSISW